MSEGRDYVTERDELIPAAVRFANKKAGKRPERLPNERHLGRSALYAGKAWAYPAGGRMEWVGLWNRLFQQKMNELARNAGLTR